MIIYDIETFPNIFTIAFEYVDTHKQYFFEISTQKNEIIELLEFLSNIKNNNNTLIGFNNLSFDYPVLHEILTLGKKCTLFDIYKKSVSIIDTDWNDRFKNIIWDPKIKQLDLFKIHHFDNIAKSTSLKMLEINMRMKSVEELPFPPNTVLNNSQMKTLREYNWHDIDATRLLFLKSKKAIQLRTDLSDLYQIDMTNFSDAKIGSTIIINHLKRAYINCSTQTIRNQISLNDCVFRMIRFEHSELKNILNKIKKTILKKGQNINFECRIDNLDYFLGRGGLHASIKNTVINSDCDHQIVDVDVVSYYPQLAIVNQLYPEHLGIGFCTIYQEMYEKRQMYKKGTPENAVLKLALNATFGNSGNQYSPFYDLKYLLSITINGQLLLLMLVEQLIKTPGLKIIQCNTDGITYFVNKRYLNHTRKVCKWWQNITKLTLKETLYFRMFITDVNNYIAQEQTTKNLKRKGKFCHSDDLQLHQNHSMQIVAKASEAYLIHNKNIADFIYQHDDIHDFVFSAKTPKNSHLLYGEQKVGNILRYIVSKKGKLLTKVMPPKMKTGTFKRKNKISDEYFNEVLKEVGDKWDSRIHTKNKSLYEERKISIQAENNVQICNDIRSINDIDINYDFYIKKTEKYCKFDNMFI